MKLKIYIILVGFFAVLITGCEDKWDDYYQNYPETVDKDVWEQMQNDENISVFVQLMKEKQLDTLFNSDIPYTFFAPANEAMQNHLDKADSLKDIFMGYHVSSHFIQSGVIKEPNKVQTLSEKYAIFNRQGGEIFIDGIKANFESPLFVNGKYFVMEDVIEPKPNFYQYFRVANPVLANYIDEQDSLILDREKSKPIGFNEQGQTIYDTVSIIYNIFEHDYFPVKEEFENLSATIVFPNEEDYNAALDVMAENMGGNIGSRADIPIDWQNNILIPHLLEYGVFLNRLEPEEFMWGPEPRDTAKLLNILGDSVAIWYTPVEKADLSNGYAYNYQDFVIPDSLYLGGRKMEGEVLLDRIGLSKYGWSDSVRVSSGAPEPLQEFVSTASNDSIIRVVFDKKDIDFSIEFNSPSLFPRKYRMVVKTHMDFGGIYDISVNGELMRTFDYYDFIRFKGIMFSVNQRDRFIPTGRFNKFDLWVDNLTEYGRAKIKFEYKGPGSAPNNGFVIDYIEFVPAED